MSNCLDCGEQMPNDHVHVCVNMNLPQCFGDKEPEPFINNVGIPNPFVPVLASIHTVSDLGVHHWYEVIYHNEEEWCCNAGSDTFRDGEQVLEWRYAKECFNN